MPAYWCTNMHKLDDRYYALLQRALFCSDPEEALSDAAALGSGLLKDAVYPEAVAEIHHNALQHLVQDYPDLKLSQVADRLTAPLIEMSMAYSMAFRWQQEENEAQRIRKAQSSRLQALGTLAAGIGHDFNTILGVMNGYAELLRDDAPLESFEWITASRIVGAGERARSLVAQMLAFARQAPVELERLDAVAAVEADLEMVRAAVPASVEITFSKSLESAYVMAGPTQMHQILMNLCRNAADAMDGVGALGIALKRSVVRLHGGLPIQGFSLIVTDTGCGMSAAVQKRVLEPFFTTKEPGKGTGLGLSVVFGIVSDLGGDMRIQSTVGVGTRFVIDLPLVGLSTPLMAIAEAT